MVITTKELKMTTESSRIILMVSCFVGEKVFNETNSTKYKRVTWKIPDNLPCSAACVEHMLTASGYDDIAVTFSPGEKKTTLVLTIPNYYNSTDVDVMLGGVVMEYS
jgi:hypothetical protein